MGTASYIVAVISAIIIMTDAAAGSDWPALCEGQGMRAVASKLASCREEQSDNYNLRILLKPTGSCDAKNPQYLARHQIVSTIELTSSMRNCT